MNGLHQLTMIHASCFCPSSSIICMLFFVKYMCHVKNVFSWTVAKSDEREGWWEWDKRTWLQQHCPYYSIIAFKTIQKEILDVHIDNGSRNMINKSSDWWEVDCSEMHQDGIHWGMDRTGWKWEIGECEWNGWMRMESWLWLMNVYKSANNSSDWCKLSTTLARNKKALPLHTSPCHSFHQTLTSINYLHSY